mgnify:CR=1 FL=1
MCFGYFYIYVIAFACGIRCEKQYFVTLGSSLEHTCIILAPSLTDDAIGLAEAFCVEAVSDLGLEIKQAAQAERFEEAFVRIVKGAVK